MSNRTVISVENLGKVYRIHRSAKGQRYVALRDVVADRVRRLFHSRNGAAEAKQDFAALKNVSFEIKQGDVVGIIGRNGAGKSTLLKILSRITEPSEGRVRIKGRVASLLEVGTGFHPELTGRENIFLNGATLGMSRAEIRAKFDEIVSFAEVEQFLDTPVKHYSSGMYMRLAFAVAAHIEPEILIVDEVLAVGDAEFQKKCLGKMGEVAHKQGRTVLFVSHNMAAVKSLTNHGIVLQAGRVVFDGGSEQALQTYLDLTARRSESDDPAAKWGHGASTRILAARLLDQDGEPTVQYKPGEAFSVEVELETDGRAGLSIELFLKDASGASLGMVSIYQFHGQYLPVAKGSYLCRLDVEPMWLASGSYSLDIATSQVNVGWDHYVQSALEFDVPFSNPLGHAFDFKQSQGYGSIALLLSKSPTFQ